MKKITLDFSKYAGVHSVDEAEKICKSMAAEILEKQKEIALEVIREMKGDGFNYELIKAKRFDLRTLNDNQRVCASGLDDYIVLMTEK